ncbi:TRAP-type C4-dicarboxylate transport system, substrate-binding protein [Vreelandella subterranea]|uniref:TRAP-type C4-dicarboxylate transport system, substrate-binding protein n=1 Tax=Vreelandella subterranea TaxID=416874 RepID=A0A1H9W8G8_9GAMM|nr:TRAP transporter substrate-binding protein DctP [Halomonas subterranea]SES30145.1 TRAP-type C4-dicarboxylate transport system, substrate-binding protein [Halomonas subterranea]
MRSRQIRKAFMQLGTLVVTSTLLVSTASANVQLKMAGIVPEGHPATEAMNEFAVRAAEQSGGEINIRVFPANQLGDYTQIYEELRRNTIEFALIPVPSQFDSRLELPSLNYAVSSWEQAESMMGRDGFISKEMEILHANLNVKQLGGLYANGFGGIGLTELPNDIHDPASEKEVLLRVPPMDVFKVAMDDLGFQTVTVPYAELYSALQTGVAEGWIGGQAEINYTNFRDVIDYYIPVNHFFESYAFLMSEKTWNELSTEHQDIISGIASDLVDKSFETARKSEEAYLQRLDESGVEVVEFSDKDRERWAEYVRETSWPKLYERLSEELVNRLREQY